MMLAHAAVVPPLDVDPQLDAIVRTALLADDTRRYQRSHELADALETWLAN